MDISRGLVTKIVDEGRLNEALRSVKTSFLDEESGPVYNYLQRHFSDYRQVPSREAVLRAFPNFQFSSPQEPLEYYIDAIREAHRYNVLDDKLNKIADVYTRDTKEAEALIRETLIELGEAGQHYQDIDVAKTAIDRIQLYDTRKANPGRNGIPTGWAALDNQTLGWQKGEFAVFVAEKYMGKSWGMIYMALEAALHGERVLFNTKEMTQDAIIRRLDSIYARVCFDSLRKGELTNVEENRYKQSLQELANKNFHFMVARQGVHTVEDIQQKAVETDATIIFADSVYLFQPDNRSRFAGETPRRMAVSQKCKAVAQDLGVPFIVSVQAGRKKTKDRVPSLDDIEWSNAFAQDGDTVFFLEKDELDRELRRAHLFVLKTRDGDVDEFFIHQDFQTMNFTQRSDTVEPTTEVFEDDDEGIFAEDV